MVTAKTCRLDAELLDGLAGAGSSSTSADHTGLHMKYLRQGGGYYINVGCSELIATADRAGPARDMDPFTGDGMRLADGTLVPADIVVLATGYQNQAEGSGACSARRWPAGWPRLGVRRAGLHAQHVDADRSGPVLADGRRAERVRLFSRFLALQIKADLEGLLLPLGCLAGGGPTSRGSWPRHGEPVPGGWAGEAARGCWGRRFPGRPGPLATSRS